ncbi:unnamed protein product [Anisakis simplex]|uniref:Hyaluronidase n=1 Tax=Anisakis simplex TaxID=6269 RepID=A0A3P6RML2_ANISI|nr:unnamed protein product [Anisakis simplex]
MFTKGDQQFFSNFMVETIKLGKRLRPHGKWGFYGFPLCNYDAGQNNDDECSTQFKAYNHMLLKILNEVDALYPSIYLENNASAEVNQRYVKAILTESKRIASKLQDPNKPIYAYSSFEYTHQSDFYSKLSFVSQVLNAYHLLTARALQHALRLGGPIYPS